MKLLDMFPQEKRDLIVKEGSLDLLVSAFISLAEEQIEKEKEDLKEKNNQPESIEDDKTVSMPVSTHNYSFNK